MNHLSDRQLARYLDGELSDIERGRFDRHLESCESCRRERSKLERASARLSSLIGDAQMSESLRSADVRPAGWSSAASAESAGKGWGSRRIAAGVAILLVAGTAALPGSPVRPWLTGVVDRVAHLVGAEGTDHAAEREFGLEVRPVDAHVVVRIHRPAPDVQVEVRLVDDSLAGVWTSGARLRSGPGLIEVVGPRSGVVDVRIPRALSEARVFSDGRELLRIGGGRVVLPDSPPGSDQSFYRFPAAR